MAPHRKEGFVFRVEFDKLTVACAVSGPLQQLRRILLNVLHRRPLMQTDCKKDPA